MSVSAQGVVERASAELSKRINGLGLRSKNRPVKASTVMERVTNVFCGGGNAPPPKPRRPKNLQPQTVVRWDDLLRDDRFLAKFFTYLPPSERRTLAQVCTRWRDVLYRNPYLWCGLVPVVRCKELRSCGQTERARFYGSVLRRGFRSIALHGATDDDALDLVQSFPLASKHLHSLTLRCSSISDRGLETLLDHLQVIELF